MYETELFEPVKILFEDLGYRVMAEVADCDVVAEKGEERIAIELKTAFNLKLIYQIVERQTVCRTVYAAIPKPKDVRSKKWRETLRLLKRLGAGLIVIGETEGLKYAQIVLEAQTHGGYINSKKSKRVKKELSTRSENLNTGGSTKTKIMTAYKENALFVACCLLVGGEMTSTEIKKYGTGDKTASILRMNYYNWFEKTDEGKYRLTEVGHNDINQYGTIADIYINKINETLNG